MTSKRGAKVQGSSSKRVIAGLRTIILCSTTLAALLVIGGVELNPGPVIETKKITRVLCNGCEKILKSGTQCDTCGNWFHNSCGNVKTMAAESGKWTCDNCRSERLRHLENKLQEAMKQIDSLTKRNRSLEEKLNRITEGKEATNVDKTRKSQEANELLVLGDSIVRNVGNGCTDVKIGCFPGIRAEQLQRVIEKRDFGNPNTVIIHVGTNDIKSSKNLDYVMGDIYELITTTKNKFASTRVILSGVLRRRDVSWRRIGAMNDRLEWVANSLDVTFVDPNSWVDDRGFGGDGLHLNRRGAQQLGQLYSRVSRAEGGRQVGRDT